MVNSAGKTLDLGELCEITPKKASTEDLKPKVFQTKIKRREYGIPVIDVIFNGKQKFEMIVDTGASRTTITQDMANALQVVPAGTERSIVANGDVVEAPLGQVASIAVDGAVVKNSQVRIAPVPLLGQNFFGNYDLTIKTDVVEFHQRQLTASEEERYYSCR